MGQTLIYISNDFFVIDDLIQCLQVAQSSRLGVNREDSVFTLVFCFYVFLHHITRESTGDGNLAAVVCDIEHGQIHKVNGIGALYDEAVDGRLRANAH